MQNNLYKNAVDHLEFSGDLYARIPKDQKIRPKFRGIRMAAIAVLITILLATTAIGVSLERHLGMDKLGESLDDFSDAQNMQFAESGEQEGVSIRYLSLDGRYSFIHGMLYNQEQGFLKITDEYTLEPVPTQRIDIELEKEGKTYTLRFDYVDSENGVISKYKSLLQKNAHNEFLLNASTEDSHQWPVYVNVETGKARDALPNWKPSDFEGRVSYVYAFRDGYLVSNLIDERTGKLYWITEDPNTRKEILFPAEGMRDYVQGDALYAMNHQGVLYALDDGFAFQKLSEYRTRDDLTDGLLTVWTKGELGIFDALTNQLYVIDGLQVNYTELEESCGYNAYRYGDTGRIALVHTVMDYEKGQIRLDQIGILDTASGALRYITIDNGYDGYHHDWLDEDRFAVMYEDGNQEYLCIYEFE